MCGMHKERIHHALAGALAGRHLLTHPFYRRWEAGTLGEGELAAYAEQYRHIERALPATLASIAAGLPEGPARALVEANLADELGVPAPHALLFESFAQAAGAASDVAPSAGHRRALGGIRSASATDPVAALAMVAAYEVQAADIAASKAEGLRRHYGLDTDGTRFWDVHTTLGACPRRLVDRRPGGVGGGSRRGHAAARVAAEAWWEFLDEREEAAAPSARRAERP